MTTKKPVLMAAGHPDNFQTPPYALDSLLPYLKQNWRIWEPACGKGNILRGLHEKGFSCTGTDITQGNRDFLNFTVSGGFDCIITNPPFSLKEQFLARCYALDKPFALLLPISTFDSKARRRLFHKNGIQLIMPDRRISFETPNGNGSSAWFYTCWFCWGLNLPSQIVFDGIEDELL